MPEPSSGRTSLSMANPPGAVGLLPGPGEETSLSQNGHQRPDPPSPQVGRPASVKLWQLRNWRVRSRLLALVIIPTITAIVLGGYRVQAARDTAANFAGVHQLAVLGSDVTSLVQSTEDERDLTAGFLAAQQSGDAAQASSLSSQLQRQYPVTDARLATVRQLAGQIGSAFPAVARNDLTTALSRVSALSALRGLVKSKIDPLAMTENYSGVITTLLAFDNDIAVGSSNAQLAQSVSALDSVVQVEDQASEERAILYSALFQGQFEPNALTNLTAAQSSETSDLAAFQATAANLFAFVPASAGSPAGFSSTLTQAQQFSDVVQGPGIDGAEAIEQNTILAGGAGAQLAGGAGNAQTWFSDMSSKLADIRSFDGSQLTAITAQANSLEQAAMGSERLTAIVVLLLLLLVLVATIAVAQSMIRPLRRLRTDALDVANHRLPDMVRRLSESDEESAQSVQIAPIGVDSIDEIGEVARAFDQVHGEAVRLAAEEAMLRANLNAMFVNLSRRSQTLIERQLGIIETLEQSEQDASRLSSLFRLDHLATRMRRNSENLLVLAGHEAPRKWTQPVVLVDVLRAAISEIEQYDRITLNVQAQLVIAGRAASDVVHLVAELVENATTFSRRDTQVLVTGQLLSSGGVLIDVTDEGLGIPEHELAYANWRLDNPPVIDVAVSRRMGLFVVGRLAARHGIKVRLRRAPSGGLSALIWVPESVAETEPTTPVGFRRRFNTGGQVVLSGAAIAEGASAVAGTRTPVLGVRTTRTKSIWFDTGELGDDGPSPAPGQSPAPGAGPGQPATVMVMPPAAGEPEPAEDDPPDGRLPIYDSIESEWFRRGTTAFSSPSGSWSSPADEGFRVAQTAVVSPATGETTSAGLPRRVPSANLVPGSVAPRPPREAPGQAPGQGTGQAPPPLSQRNRSPEAVRARLTGFQARGREGRSAMRGQPGAELHGTDEN